MRRPRWTWTRLLLRSLAREDDADAVLGDLEEAHDRRLRRHRRVTARLLTALEAADMSIALIRARLARWRVKGTHTVQDHKLAWRMLRKYPGLTVAGGLALAIAIGIGAAWYDLSRDLLRPTIPLPDGDRIVEVEMRNPLATGDERHILHDLAIWRRDVRQLEDLGAYRTLERSWRRGDGQPQPVTVAEISASAFRVARVPPILGRPLLEADERPGAPDVVVIGYSVWQREFGQGADVIGQTVRLGRTTATVVGVMPEGFAFPINHRLWTPLRLRPTGYLPLDGPPVRVFGRVAAGGTQAQANAELMVLAQRAAKESPATHQHLRPRVLAYGGESPGDISTMEKVATHLPVLMVLIVACANVATLICARTATREAEIATRYALGATRGRIVGQLFVEALVLASVAAMVGLAGAHAALQWGFSSYFSGGFSGGSDTLPFWLNPGLKLTTVLYAAGLTITGAAILGVLPALKVTGPHVSAQLARVSSGRSTLNFGFFWTAAIIGQVALTVICLPPAMGIGQEAIRDRLIRARFPAERYLTLSLDLNRVTALDESATAPSGSAPVASQLAQTYAELERRLAQEADVRMMTYGDTLPGVSPSVRTAEVEVTDGAAPKLIPNLWATAVGPRFFETFDSALLAGRDFHDGDRTAASRAVIVNQAFARYYFQDANPVGRRVRYASRDAAAPQPWLEIVGLVRDIGLTPTDRGEAPFIFTPASPATVSPLAIGLRVSGDPAALAPRVRAIAASLDLGLRLEEVRTLDDRVWRADVPAMVAAGTIMSVVGLGLFLSAAGIFSLMSVSIARRTREIALRTALGASRAQVLAGAFSRAATLVGSGIIAGNAVILLFVAISDEVRIGQVANILPLVSGVMLIVGAIACIEPARRALRIEPIEALKDA